MGISDGGVHAVEGLLLARYMMFTQLYFHKTRVIYDYHLVECLRALLESSDHTFAAPTRDGIKEFLSWHDWRVLGAISNGFGGEHGEILYNRNHHRLVHESPEIPTQDDLELLQEHEAVLNSLGCVRLSAEKSWYKTGPSEILVIPEQWSHEREPMPLSQRSAMLAGLKSIAQQRLYVPAERRADAITLIESRRRGK
jgi:HD superfamily phosphohydrolase